MSFRILVSLDGTPQAERALRYAEVLVRTAGGQLQLFRASVGGGPPDYIERALDSIARRLRETVTRSWSPGLSAAISNTTRFRPTLSRPLSPRCIEA